MRIVEEATTDTARIALEAGATEGAVVFGPDVAPRRTVTIAEARDLAARRLARGEDGLSLAARLHGHDRRTADELAHEIHASVTRGDDVASIAQALLEVDDLTVELPRYAQRVMDARHLPIGARQSIEEVLGDVERLTDPTLRAAARRLIEIGRSGTAEQVDRQIRHFVRDRALYQERVVARSETARVFADAFERSTEGDAWVVGYRWMLSPSHPRPDICDVFAGQDVDGLGPGGYAKGRVPRSPAHPNCLCGIDAIIDDDFMAREIARERGEPEPPRAWERDTRETAEEWIRRQPEAVQLSVLGPGRLTVFASTPNRVIDERGRIAPLWQARGEARPAPRSRGTRVNVSQVDPFGEAGSRRR